MAQGVNTNVFNATATSGTSGIDGMIGQLKQMQDMEQAKTMQIEMMKKINSVIMAALRSIGG
jgi:uncharacterized membrane protein